MEKLSLLKKLLEIRKSIEYLQKTERGSNGAMYVDPAVLLKKVRLQMNEHGLLLVPSLVNSAVVQVPAPTKNNPSNVDFLFTSDMVYIWMDSDSSETLEVKWFITGSHMQDPSMAEGGALTYFERYFLLKFFQIPTGKDDPEFFEGKTGEKVSEKQIIQLREIIEAKGYDAIPVMKKYCLKIANIQNIEMLLDSKFESAKVFFDDMDPK